MADVVVQFPLVNATDDAHAIAVARRCAAKLGKTYYVLFRARTGVEDCPWTPWLVYITFYRDGRIERHNPQPVSQRNERRRA